MRKALSIFLLLPLLALGSGALGWLHSQAHRMEDEHCQSEPTPDAPAREGCFIHAQLAAPLTDAAPLAPLIDGGLFVAFLTQLPVPVLSHNPLQRIDCRGPPLC